MPSGKILIVEDDRNLLEVLKVSVESAGYQVTAATEDEEALRAAGSDVFDLSIVDVHLRHRSGISLMKELHNLLPGMPVIILTAQATTEAAAQAMSQGACGYFSKPFNSRDLFSNIEKALERHLQLSKANRPAGPPRGR